MNARQTKARLKKAEQFVAKWREFLMIDPKWRVLVKCVSQPPEQPRSLAAIDVDIAEYWRVDVELYPALTDIPADEYAERADSAILHEMLHLLMWQMTSMAYNMAGDNSPLVLELMKLEEQTVQHLEDVIKKNLTE